MTPPPFKLLILAPLINSLNRVSRVFDTYHVSYHCPLYQTIAASFLLYAGSLICLIYVTHPSNNWTCLKQRPTKRTLLPSTRLEKVKKLERSNKILKTHPCPSGTLSHIPVNCLKKLPNVVKSWQEIISICES